MPTLPALRSIAAAAALAASLWSAPSAPGGAPGAAAQEPARPRRPDVIFKPTPQEVVDRMLAMAEPKPGETLYDLGCGDGRILITAARRYGV